MQVLVDELKIRAANFHQSTLTAPSIANIHKSGMKILWLRARNSIICSLGLESFFAHALVKLRKDIQVCAYARMHADSLSFKQLLLQE